MALNESNERAILTFHWYRCTTVRQSQADSGSPCCPRFPTVLPSLSLPFPSALPRPSLSPVTVYLPMRGNTSHFSTVWDPKLHVSKSGAKVQNIFCLFPFIVFVFSFFLLYFWHQRIKYMQSYSLALISQSIFIYFCYSIVPCGKFRSPYLGKAQQATATATLPIYISVCLYFCVSKQLYGWQCLGLFYCWCSLLHTRPVQIP